MLLTVDETRKRWIVTTIIELNFAGQNYQGLSQYYQPRCRNIDKFACYKHPIQQSRII